MKFAFASLLAAVALAGCADPYAPPPSPSPAPMAAGTRLAPGDCFRSADIRGHTIGDDRTLYLGVQGRGVYRVGMYGPCLANVMPSDTMLTRQPPGSPTICAPIDLDISMIAGPILSNCLPNSISRLSVAEVDALPPKLRP